MESAANYLVMYFRHVLIRSFHDNKVHVRFRADKLKDPRCFFNKVPSQKKKWDERGGALINWKLYNPEGWHDAILIVEAPKSMEQIYRWTLSTRVLGVIYEPPSWRYHEICIRDRHAEHPAKQRRQLERLEIVKAYVTGLPPFTWKRLDSLLRARAEASRSSSSPVSPAASAQSSDSPG